VKSTMSQLSRRRAQIPCQSSLHFRLRGIPSCSLKTCNAHRISVSVSRVIPDISIIIQSYPTLPYLYPTPYFTQRISPIKPNLLTPGKTLHLQHISLHRQNLIYHILSHPTTPPLPLFRSSPHAFSPSPYVIISRRI
jgi:hypothetical protein